MNQTLYITGGTGFIGRALVEHFLNQGFFVYLQTRSPEKVARRSSLQPVSSPAGIDRKVDLLINLAGKPLATRWSDSTKAEIYRSRIDLTKELFESFSQRPERAPARVLSASAIGFYQTGQDKRNENSANGANFSAKLCRDWEAAAQNFEQLESSVSILRLGVVLDKGGGSLKAMLPSFKIGLGAKLGTGNQWFSWIGLGDLTEIYAHYAQIDDPPRVINAVSPNPVTNKEFTETLASVLNRPALLTAPKFVLKAMLGEGAEDFLLANLRVAPDYLLADGFQFENPVLKDLLSENLR